MSAILLVAFGGGGGSDASESVPPATGVDPTAAADEGFTIFSISFWMAVRFVRI